MLTSSSLLAVSSWADFLFGAEGEHGVPAADDSSLTADGAAWSWNLVADCFPDDPERHPRWYNQPLDTWLQGGAAPIAAYREAAGLPEHALYFRTHQRRRLYQEFWEQGYPVGSGTPESAVMQFKMRLTGPGMRWHAASAHPLLTLRGAVLAGPCDDLWRAPTSSAPNKKCTLSSYTI